VGQGVSQGVRVLEVSGCQGVRVWVRVSDAGVRVSGC
jgi:hypothetical protein